MRVKKTRRPIRAAWFQARSAYQATRRRRPTATSNAKASSSTPPRPRVGTGTVEGAGAPSVVREGLLPAAGSVPPLLSLSAPVPPRTSSGLDGTGNGLVLHTMLSPTASVACGELGVQLTVTPEGRVEVKPQVAFSAVDGPLSKLSNDGRHAY